MRASNGSRAALIIPALGALFLTGCFESAKPSELSCTDNQYCPDGYVCVGVQPGTPGTCQRSNGDAAVDSPAPSNDLAGFDGMEDEDSSPSTDGKVLLRDVPEVLDQAQTIDAPYGLDGALDAPSSGDSGFETLSDAAT